MPSDPRIVVCNDVTELALTGAALFRRSAVDSVRRRDRFRAAVSGASNRKNGIVILDVTNPRNVTNLSEFSDGLTGGVHNLFIYDNHVFQDKD